MDIKKDLTFFNGNILQQVAFGLYQVQLHFANLDPQYADEDLHIEVVCDLEYKRADGSIRKWDSENSRASDFCINQLMELSVTNALCDDNNDLHLNFENGESLKIVSAHGLFESYVVHYQTDFEVIGFDPVDEEK
jgi:hypothetical protein